MEVRFSQNRHRLWLGHLRTSGDFLGPPKIDQSLADLSNSHAEMGKRQDVAPALTEKLMLHPQGDSDYVGLGREPGSCVLKQNVKASR